MNQNEPPTNEQLKKARELGYAAVMQHSAKESSIPGVKSAMDTQEKLAAVVSSYGERLTKKASRLKATYDAIVAPTEAAAA